MEKLIELLNEYEKEKTNQDVRFWNYYQNGFHYLEDGQSYSELLMISKKYGFIQWLVKNDKINRKKFGNSETKSSKYSDFELSYDTPREDYTNTLLMELAIQDEPIQFLIEILR